MAYIQKASVNLHGGTLQGDIPFGPGLNIIGGENGTLKTLLLQQIKQGRGVSSYAGVTPEILAVSPKRNSERRRALDALQHFRRHNRTWDTLMTERLGAAINASGFDNYPSFGEIFYLDFERRSRNGTVPAVQHMEELTNELNDVIGAIFDNYRLVSEWNGDQGTPIIHVRKHGTVDIPLESLSTGEEELLSLTTSLYVARERTDVYLVDEPEVHLNWHLEERLFAFLDRLCQTYDKQAIVVTHSRAMFKPQYLSKTIFFSWTDDGKVTWSRKLTAAQYRRIAGDAIEIIGLGDFSRPTFFVEDRAHTRFLECLARVLDIDITISECGNSSNVRSLFRLSLRESGWENSFFLTDGDNEGSPYPHDAHYIHLPVYCSDNFLIHPGLLAEVAGIPEDDVQAVLHSEILENRRQILRRNRFFDFLIDGLDPGDLTYDRLARLDASLIIEGVAEGLGMSLDDLTHQALDLLHRKEELTTHIGEDLMAAFTSYQLDEAEERTDEEHGAVATEAHDVEENRSAGAP